MSKFSKFNVFWLFYYFKPPTKIKMAVVGNFLFYFLSQKLSRCIRQRGHLKQINELFHELDFSFLVYVNTFDEEKVYNLEKFLHELSRLEFTKGKNTVISFFMTKTIWNQEYKIYRPIDQYYINTVKLYEHNQCIKTINIIKRILFVKIVIVLSIFQYKSIKFAQWWSYYQQKKW